MIPRLHIGACAAVVFAIACNNRKPAPVGPFPVTDSAPPAVSDGAAPSLTLSTEDRGALAQVIALPDGALARTIAGGLVRYNPALTIVSGVAVPAKVAWIAGNGEQVFAVLRDGQVARVGAALALEPIAKIPTGIPRWIGAHGDELLVFVQKPVGDPRDHAWQAWDFRIDRIRLVDRQVTSIEVAFRKSAAGERARQIGGEPSVFLLDGDALWFGVDAGEWGGYATRVDLASGALTTIDPGDGVFGIVAGPNHRIWLHGGIVHLGVTGGFISEVTDEKATVLFRRKSYGNKNAQKTEPKPLPIVHVVPHGAGFRVLVWHELYDVSSDLKTWTKVAAIEARENSGRPDSVGNYPATTSMIEVGGNTVFSTVKDGLFVLREGKIAPAGP
jgi:hypothetical protein